MSETNPADRRRPLNIEEIKARFPVDSQVVIKNPRAPGPVTAKVTGVRYGGEVGKKGHAVFVDTLEDRGELKPRKRSVRPAYCHAA